MSIRYSDFGRKLNNDSKRNASRSISESIRPSSSRESFYSGEFPIGSIVESDGQIQEVLDVRSNYLVLINESGQTKKKFARDVKHLPESTIKYPDNTFKGVLIGDPIRQLVEDFLAKKFSDAFAVVKCAKLFNENKTTELNNAMSSLGYIVENKTEQLAILRIIGDVIGIQSGDDAPKMITDIEKKYKTLKMSSQQKKIFNDMIALAKKQGIKINIAESDKEDSEELAKSSPGHSLRFSNDTHRHQLVRRLSGHD